MSPDEQSSPDIEHDKDGYAPPSEPFFSSHFYLLKQFF
ncbi:hypothetical protein NH44784_037731 [Achromobacter xylosoxidans NH44784-1996]|nr:hypothetical protein NH44784_037731 [Achromobacter xylosoxidans NH44784-1996]